MFRKIRIGYVLSPQCKMANIIDTDAVLSFHPLNKCYYIAKERGAVTGKANFSLVANTTYETCPDLDVLVIGEMDEREITNPEFLQFIQAKAPLAKFIIGISNGVVALYNAGFIKQEKITAAAASLEKLKALSLNVVDEKGVVRDGRLITAGPSTGAIEAAFTVFSELRGDWIAKFTEFSLEYNAPVQYPKNKNEKLSQPALPKELNVGIFAAPKIYLPDISGAVDVFGAIPNSNLFYVSHTKENNKPIIGMGSQYVSTTSFTDCPNLDVLIIGATHPKYLKDLEILNFILKQEQNASAIICICAGTFLLGSTGLLEGKNATTNYHQVSALPQIGVSPTGKEIEEDGKFFSAGPAVGSYVIGLKAVEKIIGYEWAKYIEQEVLEFAPKPLWGTNPETAGKRILWLSHLMAVILNKVFGLFLRKGYYCKKNR